MSSWDTEMNLKHSYPKGAHSQYKSNWAVNGINEFFARYNGSPKERVVSTVKERRPHRGKNVELILKSE